MSSLLVLTQRSGILPEWTCCVVLIIATVASSWGKETYVNDKESSPSEIGDIGWMFIDASASFCCSLNLCSLKDIFLCVFLDDSL
jgi:hypothetical protein